MSEHTWMTDPPHPSTSDNPFVPVEFVLYCSRCYRVAGVVSGGESLCFKCYKEHGDKIDFKRKR